MKGTFTGASNYIAAEDLLGAVNIAMALEKPLLVKGEPRARPCWLKPLQKPWARS